MGCAASTGVHDASVGSGDARRASGQPMPPRCHPARDHARGTTESEKGGVPESDGPRGSRAGSYSVDDALGAADELPPRAAAAAALCALIASTHFESGVTAAEGALVPPPLVGCLMWLLRTCSRRVPWELPAAITATPYPYTVLSHDLNRAAARRIAPLIRAVNEARLPFVLDTPEGARVRSCPRSVHCEVAVKLATASKVPLAVVARRRRDWLAQESCLVDQFALEFDGRLRLALANAHPNVWFASVHFRDCATATGLPGQNNPWQREFRAVNLGPPRADANPTEAYDAHASGDGSGQRDTVHTNGDADEALRALNEVAAALGFRPQIGFQSAAANDAREYESTHATVVSSPASELMRCLGDGVAPLSTESFGRVFTPGFDRDVYNEQLKELEEQ